MASRKSYLYGLGTGLIAGAVLLQLASIGETAVSLSDDELAAAAAASNLVLKDARVTWYTETEVEARVEAALQRMQREASERSEQPDAGADRNADKGTEEEGTEAVPPVEAGKPDKVYAFTIASGTELASVAKLLYELGLIDDYNGFLLEMEERGLAGKVQAKHYRFDGVPTLDELIAKLTTS